jgi:hypothetical protein
MRKKLVNIADGFLLRAVTADRGSGVYRRVQTSVGDHVVRCRSLGDLAVHR